MNVFNKIVVVILLLFLAVGSIVSIVNIFVNLYEISYVADRIVNYFTHINQFILALVLFAVLIVSLVLLVLEFYKKKLKVASISSDQSGKTMIALKTISNQIKEKLDKMENVIDPRVNIVPKSNGIVIDIFSALVKGENVSQKTDDIRKAATEYASGELGFRVIQTNYTATNFVAPKEEIGQDPGANGQDNTTKEEEGQEQ